MTLIDYIAQMGGLLGFGLGFSLVSGVELVYWFTVRLWRNRGQGKRKGKKLKQTSQ